MIERPCEPARVSKANSGQGGVWGVGCEVGTYSSVVSCGGRGVQGPYIGRTRIGVWGDGKEKWGRGGYDAISPPPPRTAGGWKGV